MFGFRKKGNAKSKTAATVAIAAFSSRGGRAKNEDSYGYWQNGSKGICVLADGLGGHGNGELASRTAVRTIVETLQKNDSCPMEQLMAAADQAVRAEQQKDPSKSAMRTTVVMAKYDLAEGKLMFGYAGDSRLYIFKNGIFYKHTKDHSLSQLAVDMGRITEDQLRSHADRNQVTKVLGAEDDVSFQASCFGVEKIGKGDAFLLCSDGVWEYVFDKEMELELKDAASPEAWIEGIKKRLLSRAKENHDNYTMVCGIL